MVRSKQTTEPAGAAKRVKPGKKSGAKGAEASAEARRAAKEERRAAKKAAKRERKREKKTARKQKEEEEEEEEEQEEEEDQEEAKEQKKRGRRMKPGKRALIEVKNAQKYSAKSSKMVFKYAPLRQKFKELVHKYDSPGLADTPDCKTGGEKAAGPLRIREGAVHILGLMLENRLLKIYNRGFFLSLYVAKKRTLSTPVFNVAAKLELSPHELPTAAAWLDTDPYAASAPAAQPQQ